MTPSRDISRLLEIMAALRTPGTGCPWDLEQNFATIAPYTLEEAYEVADAIARGDLDDLREELGDLLLQVAFHARMAEEQGAFDFGSVVEAITEKLLRRHPHVFGDQRGLSAKAVEGLWQQIKDEEKAAKPARQEGGALAGVPGRQGRIRLERSARSTGQDP
jgi:ATP diphosphatase